MFRGADFSLPQVVEELVEVLGQGSTSPFGADLEQIVDIPVPQVVVVLVEVFTVFSQDRNQQRFAEQIFQTLATSLTVKIIEVPVIRTQEKTQQLVNTHVQHVVNTVEVEKPKLIKETVTEVFTHFSQDRVQQRFADQIFQTLATSLAEKIRERNPAPCLIRQWIRVHASVPR